MKATQKQRRRVDTTVIRNIRKKKEIILASKTSEALKQTNSMCEKKT